VTLLVVVVLDVDTGENVGRDAVAAISRFGSFSSLYNDGDDRRK
jgi:hypothetical protein